MMKFDNVLIELVNKIDEYKRFKISYQQIQNDPRCKKKAKKIIKNYELYITEFEKAIEILKKAGVGSE